jgi:hypothetical protein
MELLPIAMTSTTIGALWGCRSDAVSILLQKIEATYPDEFFWKALHKGRRGPKPSVFELRIMPGLVEKLMNEQEERVLPAEDILTLVA